MTRDELIEELKKLPNDSDIEFRVKIDSEYGPSKIRSGKFQRLIWSSTPIIEIETR